MTASEYTALYLAPACAALARHFERCYGCKSAEHLELAALLCPVGAAYLRRLKSVLIIGLALRECNAIDLSPFARWERFIIAISERRA